MTSTSRTLSPVVRFLLLLLSSSVVTAFSSHNYHHQTATKLHSKQPITRSNFFKASASSATFLLGNVALLFPSPTIAKDIDPALKGTKDDPKYQACVSQCLYECTKPKGGEQKSRVECIPGCKKECATSKAQLMIGTPKKD